MRKALIFGISGQDGAYLAHLLLQKGYEVIGTSRDAQVNTFKNLSRLNILNRVTLESVSLSDFRSLINVVAAHKPDEIYNLAGQTSVGLSFNMPVETMESIIQGTLNILEAIRFIDKDIKFYNAGSSECFGNAEKADEQTRLEPRSPYAVAKSASFWMIKNYRESYNIFASTGILFNHESILRPERFVTQKIIKLAKKVKAKELSSIKLGNLDIVRDWGWAPEYVEAMWKMMQLEKPQDLVICTGKSFSLRDFVKTTFEVLELDYTKHVISDPELFRPSEIMKISGNPLKAKDVLGWTPQYSMPDIIRKMIKEDLF